MRLFIIFLLLISALPASSQVKHIIEVHNYRFEPNVINIDLGDTIEWVWMEGQHTTSSISVPSGGIPWSQNIDSLNKRFVYVPVAYGLYGYFCQVHGMSMNMSGTIGVWDPNGVGEKDSNRFLNVFPNPATDRLLIKSQGIDIEKFSIYSAEGRLLKQGSIDTLTLEINVESLSAGVYLLVVTDGKQHHLSSRFIKQ